MTPVSDVADGPSAAALAGPGALAVVRRGFLATRPKFYTASILPVLVGTAWAAGAHGAFDGLLFALAILATVLAHGFSNVYNDVGDDIGGTDPINVLRIYPYTGGSRFIQNGVLSRDEMFRLAVGLAAGAMAVGLVLALLRGWGVIAFGLAGLAVAWLYSKPGVMLSGRGVGELAVAAGLGALPVIGATWLQSGIVDGGTVLLAVMVSVWVALILLVNEVPDSVADARAGKHTWVVRLGEAGTRRLYVVLTLLGAVAGVALVVRGDVSAWVAVPVVLFAIGGWLASRGITLAPAGRPGLKKSIEATLAIHAVGSLALVVAALLA